MDGDLGGAEAVLAEAGVLGGAARVAALELAQQVLAQLALALAVDEDDALAVLVDVGVHHLAELVHLVFQDSARRHAVQVVHQRADVQVLDDDAVGVGLLLDGLALRAVEALFLLHGALELAAVDAHLAGWTVVGDNLHGDDRHVKVGILVEAMHLVELGDVEALLDEGGILELEALALLECHILHGHMGHAVEVVVAELLEFDLDVGLDDAVVAGLPLAVAVAAGHIGEIEEVVAVVDQRGIEGGRVQVLDLARLISQHYVEHFALGGLLDGQGGLGDGLRPGCGLVGLDLAGADVERTLISRGLGACLPHNDQLLLQRGALKAVLVLYIDGLAVDSGNSAASHIVEEAHDIVDFNVHDVVSFFFRLRSYKKCGT